MRRGFVSGLLSAVIALLFTACVLPSSGRAPTADSVTVLPADARALRYGATAPEVFDNPMLRDKLHGLFGADWSPGPGRAFGAPAFFPPSAPIRMVRMAGRDYITISGCVTGACEGHRGLLLIGPDEQLLARLDDGGFSHYYDYGPSATGGTGPRLAIDGAWLAIAGTERG